MQHSIDIVSLVYIRTQTHISLSWANTEYLWTMQKHVIDLCFCFSCATPGQWTPRRQGRGWCLVFLRLLHGSPSVRHPPVDTIIRNLAAAVVVVFLLLLLQLLQSGAAAVLAFFLLLYFKVYRKRMYKSFSFVHNSIQILKVRLQEEKKSWVHLYKWPVVRLAITDIKRCLNTCTCTVQGVLERLPLATHTLFPGESKLQMRDIFHFPHTRFVPDIYGTLRTFSKQRLQYTQIQFISLKDINLFTLNSRILKGLQCWQFSSR